MLAPVWHQMGRIVTNNVWTLLLQQTYAGLAGRLATNLSHTWKRSTCAAVGLHSSAQKPHLDKTTPFTSKSWISQVNLVQEYMLLHVHLYNYILYTRCLWNACTRKAFRGIGSQRSTGRVLAALEICLAHIFSRLPFKAHTSAVTPKMNSQQAQLVHIQVHLTIFNPSSHYWIVWCCWIILSPWFDCDHLYNQYHTIITDIDTGYASLVIYIYNC